MDAAAYSVDTPVALLIFNRPETTRRVFEVIRRARPARLFVVADGPRDHVEGERERCRDTRAVLDSVDWSCDVMSHFSDKNMGCRRRISSGLDWVFENTDEAIILEDDCLPDPSFFMFCDELLRKYRNDERVGMISGDNFLFGTGRRDFSYYFSAYTHIWGWASWKRAWRRYDEGMESWPRVRKTRLLDDWLGDPVAAEYWTRTFDRVHDGAIDTWDYQILFAAWMGGALTVLPRVNLVSNIGFAAEGTHTTSSKSPLANIPTSPMDFPLSHPPAVARDFAADRHTEKFMFSGSLTTRRRIKMRMARLFLRR